MALVDREIADKYQNFFNFMYQEHSLMLTMEEMDEIVFEAQRFVKEFGTMQNTSKNIIVPVIQNDNIKEKCCNNCKHNGNQFIYPSACTGCGSDEEYSNHVYSTN